MAILLMLQGLASTSYASNPTLAELTAEKLASQWDSILPNIVRNGLVDYSRAQSSESFAHFITELKKFDASTLKSPNAKKAHLINLYNALTVDLIVEHYPVTSIKQIGSWFSTPWSIDVTVFAGQRITLDDIEHKMLRKMGDPRIHFAINCASISCPKLSAQAYRAELIDEQLDQQRLEFISSPQGVQYDGDELRVSKIFSWFDEDWGGRDGVLAMLKKHHAEGSSFEEITSYLHYDWSLNQAPPVASDIIR